MTLLGAVRAIFVVFFFRYLNSYALRLDPCSSSSVQDSMKDFRYVLDHNT